MIIIIYHRSQPKCINSFINPWILHMYMYIYIYFPCGKHEPIKTTVPLPLERRRKQQQPEKGEIKSHLIGVERISKKEESLSSLTGAPLHINERLGRNYILLPVRIHMPNYNIFIKWECNFHKGDYKRSTRSGKALFVLCIPLECWCATENDEHSRGPFGDCFFSSFFHRCCFNP